MLLHKFRYAAIGRATCALAFVSSFAVAQPDSAIAASSVAQEEFPVPEGFVSGYRETDGVNFHYVKGGKGPLVVLVHGFAQTWYEWRELMPLLAKSHTVIAVDLPALGLSSPPKSYAGQDVARQIYDFAKSFSTSQAFDLVAHDIGIWNTYPMVVEHQKNIRRVVFMEAPIPDESIYQWPGFTPQGPAPTWHFSFFSSGDLLPEKLVTGNERTFFGFFMTTHAVNKTVFTPELLDLYSHSYAKPQSLHGSFEYYRALNETVRRNQPLAATKLTMPVLAIGGGSSMGKMQADQMQKYATNVQGAVLQGCGHWVPEECGDALNPMIVNFLGTK